MNKLLLRTLSGLVLFAVALSVQTQGVSASSVGLSGWSGIDTGNDCSSCHTGGPGTTVPQMSVTGAAQVLPSATVSYMLAITSTSPMSQTVAGWNLKIADDMSENAGSIDGFDEATSRLEFGELTHVAPQMNDANGVVTVAFDWTAPSELGTYTIYYAGNSANNNGQNGAGDAGAVGSFDVTVSQELAVGLQGNSAEITSPYIWLLALPLLPITLYRLRKR